MSPLICLDSIQLPVFPSLPPSPCRGDLPCLLTDNSDRKLLHVITLLKSQFTQPQQIILRWVPGVMETVFSTLRPACPALSKPPWVSVFRSGDEEAHPFLLFVSMFLLSPSLLSLILFPCYSPTSLFLLLPFILSSGFKSKGLQCVSSGWHYLLLN